MNTADHGSEYMQQSAGAFEKYRCDAEAQMAYLRAQLTTERTLREAAEREINDCRSNLRDNGFLAAMIDYPGDELPLKALAEQWHAVAWEHWLDKYEKLAEQLTAAQTALASAREDGERLDWLERVVFADGGNHVELWRGRDDTPAFQDNTNIATGNGPYRKVFTSPPGGITLRAALDAALSVNSTLERP